MMLEKDFWISMPDEVNVYVKKWYQADQQPKAIVQLSHGMVEHIQRYDDFAQFLVTNNIFVYGNDHRGHGKTGERQGQLGYFSDHDGFKKVAEDLHEITQIIKEKYPTVPLFLFGHSMGSFLARKYIQSYSHEIDGVILSGTGFFPSFTTKLGKSLARLLPAEKESHVMNHIAFGSYQTKIKNVQTDFDWLTRDRQAVQTYLDDPSTGYVPTARFFYDLMDGLGTIHRKKANETIRKDLPILFMSGEADPVGDYSKGIWKVANLYHQMGIKHIKVMLYIEGRHELLNELNKTEVYEQTFEWMNALLQNN